MSRLLTRRAWLRLAGTAVAGGIIAGWNVAQMNTPSSPNCGISGSGAKTGAVISTISPSVISPGSVRRHWPVHQSMRSSRLISR